MRSGQAVFTLRLFGTPSLLLVQGGAQRLERKAAGLLAWLAVEGGGERARLADLLWPGAAEATARNNLSQTLRRLREVAGGLAPVAGQPSLVLAPGWRADVAQLLDAHRAGRHQQVTELPGEFLAGLNYDDCPDFQAWVEHQRARIAACRSEAFTALADAVETAGAHRDAIGHARRLLELDPCSEAAHVRLMRLLWLAGDRAAALAAYDQCRATLMRELGVLPGPEILALLRDIEQGAAPAGFHLPRRPVLPPALLRPPALVGREAVWRQMEAAWERGLAIFISGAPGVGKTRLMQEFLGSKGRFYAFEGRPDDFNVPYATHSRTYRQMLRAFPGINLPGWVRQELARMLPELAPPAPAPLASPDDKLRFFHAQAETTRLAVEAGMRLVGVDDLQFVDLASLEAGHFVYAQHWGRTDGMHTIMCFRAGELAPEAAQAMGWVLDRGYGVLVELGALTEAAVADMLAGVDPALVPLAPLLHQHAGGNPFFVLETVKALYESGVLAAGLPERLPVPAKVQALLSQRLARLSAPALELARLAAVAGSRFGPDLAARVLDRHPHQLAEPWAELEAAQILVGNGFVHTLFHEVVLEGIPAPVRAQLAARFQAETQAGAG